MATLCQCARLSTTCLQGMLAQPEHVGVLAMCQKEGPLSEAESKRLMSWFYQQTNSDRVDGKPCLNSSYSPTCWAQIQAEMQQIARGMALCAAGLEQAQKSTQNQIVENELSRHDADLHAESRQLEMA